MPRTNQDFNKSRREKDNEYYTLYKDVADEVGMYLSQLKGMRILCPCDWNSSFEEHTFYTRELGIITEPSPTGSQFVRYLIAKAEQYGFESVTASGYDERIGQGIKFQDINYTKYDVIITNPPFSLFGEFIDTLIGAGKKFLVIGSLMDCSLKNIVSYFQHEQIRIGYHYHLSGFLRPDGTIMPKQDSTPRCCQWFTNLVVELHQRPLVLTESYEESPEQYPHYTNYNAIECTFVRKIPNDYYGAIGVPVSFLQSYNPNQFEIIGESNELAISFRDENGKLCSGRFYTKNADQTLHRCQPRLIIKRKM